MVVYEGEVDQIQVFNLLIMSPVEMFWSWRTRGLCRRGVSLTKKMNVKVGPRLFFFLLNI